jgi:hypothetical protein
MLMGMQTGGSESSDSLAAGSATSVRLTGTEADD